MKAVGAERPARVGEELADHPANRRQVGHLVPLGDVSKNHHVHVTLQQEPPVAGLQSLGLGKTPGDEILAKRLLQVGTLAGAEKGGVLRDLGSGMAQGLVEPERVNDRLDGAAPHAGGHFAAQQAGRGSRQEEIDLLGIENPSGKALPPVDQLDFVEKERYLFAASVFGALPVVFLEEEGQVVPLTWKFPRFSLKICRGGITDKPR